jgi:hypothetical protein
MRFRAEFSLIIYGQDLNSQSPVCHDTRGTSFSHRTRCLDESREHEETTVCST